MHRGVPKVTLVALALSILAGCATTGSSTVAATPSGVLGGARSGEPPSPGPSANRELTVDEQAHHVLNRLAFGARPGEVDRVLGEGVDRWIARQLDPAGVEDAANDAVVARYRTLGMTAGEMLRAYPPPAVVLARQQQRQGGALTRSDSLELRRMAQDNRRLVGEIMSARVARAVGSERQLQEVMTDFWLNHFSVFVGKGQLRYYLPDYERTAIRPHALGRFRELLGAVATSPAMLFYLDNAQSVADSTSPTLATRRDERRRRLVEGAVRRRQVDMTAEERARLAALQARRPRGLNENYARELLELHTLGVDGGYTQQDIIEVARALTGWTIRPPRQGEVGFLFNGAAHDAGEKSILGTRFPAGRGQEEGERVLDLLARHPSTARYIAHKLATRFVSDSPPPALVERAAATYRRTDGNIREIVRTIVTSDEFFARAAYRSKVKSPFEVVVSAVRALGGRADTTAVSSLAVARLGQPIYGHQAPDGWPETGAEWMNTGAILGRINFGLTAAAGRIPNAAPRAWPAYDKLRTASRDVQVAAVIDAFLGAQASAETREVLSSGENPLMSRAGSMGADSAASDEVMLDQLSRDDSTSGSGVTLARRGRNAGGPPRGNGMPGSNTAPNQNRAERRLAMQSAAPAPPQLTGLDQIIGLALGSPEFQRR